MQLEEEGFTLVWSHKPNKCLQRLSETDVQQVRLSRVRTVCTVIRRQNEDINDTTYIQKKIRFTVHHILDYKRICEYIHVEHSTIFY